MNSTAPSDPFCDALSRFLCSVQADLSLEVTPAPGAEIKDQAGARAWFADLCKEDAIGWAQFSDKNLWVANGICKSEPQGILLAAELHVPAKDVSHHLRHDGKKWIAVEIRRVIKENAFIEQRSFLNSRKGSEPLTYEVAWETGGNGALRPVSFRLTGLKTK